MPERSETIVEVVFRLRELSTQLVGIARSCSEHRPAMRMEDIGSKVDGISVELAHHALVLEQLFAIQPDNRNKESE